MFRYLSENLICFDRVKPLYFPQRDAQLSLGYWITTWNNAIRLNWMKSWGMSTANSFFNCYIQLGIQISLFSRSVSETMPALFVSICSSEGKEERKCERDARSRASPNPWDPRDDKHIRTLCLCSASLFSNLNSFLTPPSNTRSLNGPLISTKWRSVNMRTGGGGPQLARARLTAAWFHWQL